MGNYVTRIQETDILLKLADKKAIIIYGARQVGKSTLLKHLLKDNTSVLWLYGDQAQTQSLFNDLSVQSIKSIIGKKKIIVIDEAQMIKDIGIKLKMFTDYLDDIKVIATGSSSFDLANKINEPLTGRKWEYHLLPLSFREMANESSEFEEKGYLETRLIYGYYPEIVMHPGEEKERLLELVTSYLYKDVLIWESLQKADKITRLLQALAFQTGSQISYSEIGTMIGMDSKTVEKYIDLLEKAFIIYRLTSYSRNLRNELKASKKVYFYDNGVRNALISAFNPLELRDDIGILWENFIMAELLKKDKNTRNFARRWFWRTKQSQEVDLIHEADGVWSAYEFKWNEKKNVSYPAAFKEAYPEINFHLINKSNFIDYL
ncbi:MAG: ATP-binding protein [Treponema sp.]|nr:ATP-binding protein [Treponema sp.]MCL2250638.1 ATP-binding protein [Treponema sp.]